MTTKTAVFNNFLPNFHLKRQQKTAGIVFIQLLSQAIENKISKLHFLNVETHFSP